MAMSRAKELATTLKRAGSMTAPTISDVDISMLEGAPTLSMGISRSLQASPTMPERLKQQLPTNEIIPAPMPDMTGQLSDEERMRAMQMIKPMPDMTGQLSDEERMMLMQRIQEMQGQPVMMQEGGDPMMEMMGEEPMTEEEMQFVSNLQAQGEAPMFELASQLAQFGRGGDDQIVHAETGDVIIPPQVMEADEQLSQAVFDGLQRNNINPEERVVGSGIASLNPETGLQEFGWLKKTFKKVGKFVKKAAPIAMLIPGVGSALGAVAGSLGSGIAGLAAKIPGIGGALSSGLGTAGKLITSGAKGLGSLISKVPGMGGVGQNIMDFGTLGAGAAKGGLTLGQALQVGKTNIGAGIQSLMASPFKTLTQGIQGMPVPQQQVSSIEQIYAGADPSTQARIDRLISEGATEQQILANLQQSGMLPAGMPQTGAQQQGGSFFGMKTPSFIKGIEDTLKGQTSPTSSSLFAGLGDKGFGLGDVGAFGLAGLLGKMAYEEAKGQKGVPLTPLVTMGPTGRYNIEAEIARRMGQQAPNPVEFGLLPSGTIPELTGGKAMGGAVQGFFQGGSVAKMNEGGELEVELDMSDFERMNGGINGEGTETSDDIPAMLSDGEFVMTGRAVRGAGSYELQQGENGIISLIPSFEEDRERGTQLMYQIMDMFAESARAS